LVPLPFEAVFLALCDNADAAADLDSLLVRPSRRTLDAAEAAFDEVSLEVFLCERALPAADLELLPVSLLESTEDAFFAALPPVDFPAMFLPLVAVEKVFPQIPSYD